MIISVVAPHTKRSGNTVSSILLGLALSDLKRKVLLTHVQPKSPAFHHYLGLKDYDDKTSTPSQLVKLMREGAIQTQDIGDYCKSFEDFLDVFTNNETNFSEQDMNSLLGFLTTSDTPYEYMLFDVDASVDDPSAELVLAKSDIIILNVNADIVGFDAFNNMRDRIMKLCRGKKVILLCSDYSPRALKSAKLVSSTLGLDTSCYVIRHNDWVQWSCNQGRLAYLYKQGKVKDADVLEVFKDVSSLASAVARTKVIIGRTPKGVFKS